MHLQKTLVLYMYRIHFLALLNIFAWFSLLKWFFWYTKFRQLVSKLAVFMIFQYFHYCFGFWINRRIIRNYGLLNAELARVYCILSLNTLKTLTFLILHVFTYITELFGHFCFIPLIPSQLSFPTAGLVISSPFFFSQPLPFVL